jgi:kynurenine formamidase
MQLSALLVLAICLIKQSISAVIFDLTHTIKSTNPIFPGQTSFNFTQRVAEWRYDSTDTLYFSAFNEFITSEHSNTHLDAPYHGSNSSWTVEQIPFERLVAVQALIVDVSKQCANTKNYEIVTKDLNEILLQEIDGFFVLLFYTGQSRFWPNQLTYAGGDTREQLAFPGLSPQLATYLVNTYANKLVGVGIDTLSIDPGSSKDFLAHRILFKHNIYALENVASLDLVLKQLSRQSSPLFMFDVLPMKIGGGSGAPCRLVARIEYSEKPNGKWFGLLIFIFLVFALGICVKAVYDLKFHPEKDLG